MSCGILKKKKEVLHYSSYPDTDAYPSLTLNWNRALDNTSVNFLGAFGVWEGAPNHPEIASEIEIHLDHGGESIYALADGRVVEIQASEHPDYSGEVEGVWIRYGNNFLLKYVHVDYPTVQAGDIVHKGQRIGQVHFMGTSGFYEVEARLKLGGDIFAVCILPYFDAASRQTLIDLWADNTIRRTVVPDPTQPWCTGDRQFATNMDRPEHW